MSRWFKSKGYFFKDSCFDYLFLFSLSCRLLHIHFCLQLFSVCNELDLTFNLSIPFLFLINCVLKKQKIWIRSHKKSVNVLCEIVSPQAGTWVKFKFINSKSPWCLWFYQTHWGGERAALVNLELDQVYCAWLSKGLLCLYILKKWRFGRVTLMPHTLTHRQQNILYYIKCYSACIKFKLSHAILAVFSVIWSQ